MRRYFYKARHAAPREAHRALVYFRQLYMLERELADVSSEQRNQQRRERALPLLEEFKTWLDERAPAVIPKTEIATAVGDPARPAGRSHMRFMERVRLNASNTLKPPRRGASSVSLDSLVALRIENTSQQAAAMLQRQ